MKKKLLSIIIMMSMLLSACGGQDQSSSTPTGDTAPNEEKTADEPVAKADESWAIYWYLCGSDLESQNGFATTDLVEAMSVTLPDNVTVVIQTGGASEWNNSTISADNLGRYVLAGGDLEKVDEQELANMGDPETLASFLSFCNENYPADHRMALFWDHGGGSTSGAAYDELFDGDYLSVPELKSAFEATCTPSADNPPYDIIGFDTCLMATLDVSAAFSGIGKYLVASEETEPGVGWAYDGWLDALAKNTSITPADLGKSICDTYYSACEEQGLADDVTLSVTDLSKIGDVLEKYNALGNELFSSWITSGNTAYVSEFERAAQKSDNYGGNTKKSGFSDMVDIGSLANKCAEILPESSAALSDAVAAANVYKVQGPYHKKASGLSCFYSYSGNNKYFKGYKKASETPVWNYYYDLLINGNIGDDAETYLSELIGSDTQPEMAEPDESDYEDHELNIIDGNTAELDLGYEAASFLSSVSYSLAVYKDDYMLYLGTNNNITEDWENGVFRDDFDGTWGSIDDHLVYMEVANSEDGFTTYSIPIKLNGKDCLLQTGYDKESETGVIMGVSSEIEDGMARKDLRKLEPGDEITTQVVGVVLKNGDTHMIDLETFKVDENTSFGMKWLGDADYAIQFEMMTTNKKEYSSALETFSVKDGVMAYN